MLGDKEFDGKATIKIPIEEVVTEVVELFKENITITNIPEDYQVTMVDVPDYMELEMTGTMSLIREIMTGDVTAKIDMNEALEDLGLSEWSSGTYTVEANLNVSEYVSHTPVKIVIEIEKNS
mgnify:FL=1